MILQLWYTFSFISQGSTMDFPLKKKSSKNFFKNIFWRKKLNFLHRFNYNSEMFWKYSETHENIFSVSEMILYFCYPCHIIPKGWRAVHGFSTGKITSNYFRKNSVKMKWSSLVEFSFQNILKVSWDPSIHVWILDKFIYNSKYMKIFLIDFTVRYLCMVKLIWKKITT